MQDVLGVNMQMKTLFRQSNRVGGRLTVVGGCMSSQYVAYRKDNKWTNNLLQYDTVSKNSRQIGCLIQVDNDYRYLRLLTYT